MEILNIVQQADIQGRAPEESSSQKTVVISTITSKDQHNSVAYGKLMLILLKNPCICENRSRRFEVREVLQKELKMMICEKSQ